MIDDRSVVTERPVPTWNDRGVDEVSSEVNERGVSGVHPSAGDSVLMNSSHSERSASDSCVEFTEERCCSYDWRCSESGG